MVEIVNQGVKPAAREQRVFRLRVVGFVYAGASRKFDRAQTWSTSRVHWPGSHIAKLCAQIYRA